MDHYSLALCPQSQGGGSELNTEGVWHKPDTHTPSEALAPGLPPQAIIPQYCASMVTFNIHWWLTTAQTTNKHVVTVHSPL